MEIITLILNVFLVCFSIYLVTYNCSVVIGSNKAPFQQNWLGLSLVLASCSPILTYVCPQGVRDSFIVHFTSLTMAYANLYVTRFNRSIKKPYIKGYVAVVNAFVVLIIFYMLTSYYKLIQPDAIFSTLSPFNEGIISNKPIILVVSYFIFTSYNIMSILLDIKLVKYQITVLKIQTLICTTALFLEFITNVHFVNTFLSALMLLTTEICIFSILVPIKGRFYKYDV